jgi:hypothetical protein
LTLLSCTFTNFWVGLSIVLGWYCKYHVENELDADVPVWISLLAYPITLLVDLFDESNEYDLDDVLKDIFTPENYI